MKTKARESVHRVASSGADIGFIGRGDSVEECFAQTARAMFSFMTDVNHVRPLHILSFEFEEADFARALTTWLNLLLTKCQEHHIMLSDFRLKREGPHWKATVSGGPSQSDFHETVSPTTLSIKKMGPTWEARCKLKWT